jgi:ketosteroid isomerase-like protein
MTAMPAAIPILLIPILGACGGSRQPVAPASEPAEEPALGREGLRRDLEATVLEGYSQLTLGNLDAYREGIAADRQVTLVGVSPRDVVMGRAPRALARDRRLYRELGPTILSKNLDVHLSRDGSVGWIYDEISYRVPYMGRTASIPIRRTALYVRELDRWLLVMEHESYALPVGEIVDLAARGALEPPRRLDRRYRRTEGPSSLLLRVIERLQNGSDNYRRQKVSADHEALLLLPHPEGEIYGADVPASSSVAALFGSGASVSLRDYRVFVSPSISSAWIAANLVITTDVRDETVEIGLRATYVLENRDKWGWQVVQTHVSAPLAPAELSRHVFGAEVVQPVTR